MSRRKLEHTYLPFDGASIIDRRHEREVKPPGFVDLKNFIPPRSDASPTLRPDIWYTNDYVYSIQNTINFNNVTEITDSILAVTGLAGENQLLYFTPFLAWGSSDGSYQILSDTHSDGSVSGFEGLSDLHGKGTSFYEKAYRGALMKLTPLGTPEFSGAPYKFVASTGMTGAEYLAEVDETPIDFDGFEVNYLINASTYPYQFVSIRASDALINNSYGIGDEDTLSAEALYVKPVPDADGTLYNDYSGSGLHTYLDLGINISGSDLEWVASVGADEYYLAKKDGGGPPDFVPDFGDLRTGNFGFSSFFKGDERYVGESVNSFNNKQLRPTWTGKLGTPGTLDLYQIGVGQRAGDGLSADTYYVNSDPYWGDADPNTRKSVKSYRDFQLTTFYARVSESPYTWHQSADADKVYYLKKSAGDPQVPEPHHVGFTPSGWGYMRFIRSKIDMPTTLSNATLFQRCAWGDKDSLGYNTIYLYSDRGNPGNDSTYEYFLYYFGTLNNPTYSGFEQWLPTTPTWKSPGYTTSEYSWVKSLSGATNDEYYLAQSDGSPLAAAFTEPAFVTIGGWYRTGSVDSPTGDATYKDDFIVNYTKNTIGSLNDLEWGYGQHASDVTLSHDTIYIKYSYGDPNEVYLPVVAHYVYDVYTSQYKWNASSVANTWYLTKNDGTTTGLTQPTELSVGGESWTYLANPALMDPEEFSWGDIGGEVGFDTLYIYSTTDPNGTIGTGLEDEVPPLVVSTEVEEDDEYYIVESVVDDDNLKVYGTLSSTFNNATPTFYYNHNAFNSDYKLNVQGYTSGIIYSSPNIDSNSLDADISGPFYAGLIRGEWAYDGVIGVDENYVGNGVEFENQPSLAEKVGIIALAFSAADYPTGEATDDLPETKAIAYTVNPAVPNAWTKLSWNISESPDSPSASLVVQGDTGDMILNSIQADDGSGWIAGCQCIDGGYLDTSPDQCNPGIAWSNSAIPTLWNTIINTNYAAWTDPNGVIRKETEWQTICAARNIDECVSLTYQPSTGTIWIDYCPDIQAASPAFTQKKSFTGTVRSKVYYSQNDGIWFVISNESLYYSSDGSSWTTIDLSAIASNIQDFAWDDQGNYMIAMEDMKIAWTQDYTSENVSDGEEDDPLNYMYDWNIVTLVDEPYQEYLDFMSYDSIGERWVTGTGRNFWWSEDMETWKFLVNGELGESGQLKRPTNTVTGIGYNTYVLYDGGADYIRAVVTDRYNYYYWEVDKFVPLSDVYRAATFSVLDGYVGLFSTTEWEQLDDGTYGWVSYPRRFRYTAPATYNDFESEGSGLADAPGEGKFLDSRPVNGRIVAFETNKVSAIVPRGDVDDPFDYEVIQEDFRILSNPVRVNDIVYVVSSDGLIYKTDGINVMEAGFSYDATRFEDYQEKKPINLDYSSATNCLTAFYYDSTASEQEVYFISLSGGSVTRCVLPNHDDGVTQPEHICSVSFCDDKRLIVPYIPNDSQTSTMRVGAFRFGSQITGLDRLDRGGSNTSYWSALLESGELYIQPEGGKSSLKHVIVSTYCGTTIGDGDDTPRIIIQIKPTGSDEWLTPEQFDWEIPGIDVTTSSATLQDYPSDIVYGFPTNLIWDNVTSGTTGDVDVGLPCSDNHITLWKNVGSTYTQLVSGTDYTPYDYTTFWYAYFPAGSFSSNTYIYGDWKCRPYATMEVGDVLEFIDGYHRVTDLSLFQYIGLDHYPVSANTFSKDTGEDPDRVIAHYKTVQLETGEGKSAYGVNQLVEGFRMRAVVIPEYGSDNAPTSVKIVGVSLGFVPQGRKTLTATGS